MDLEQAVEYARRRKEVLVGTPASEDEVRAAEKTLGVTFPSEYVELLTRCGGLSIEDGQAICGLSSAIGDLEFPTIVELAAGPWISAVDQSTHWPKGVIRIDENGGFGYYVILDASLSDPCVYNVDIEQFVITPKDRTIDGLVCRWESNSLAAWIKKMADRDF
jgi:hypothetical protein